MKNTLISGIYVRPTYLVHKQQTHVSVHCGSSNHVTAEILREQTEKQATSGPASSCAWFFAGNEHNLVPTTAVSHRMPSSRGATQRPFHQFTLFQFYYVVKLVNIRLESRPLTIALRRPTVSNDSILHSVKKFSPGVDFPAPEFLVLQSLNLNLV